MIDDERGQGIIRVLLGFLGAMFALWILTIVVGAVLEPLYVLAAEDAAVESQGFGDAIEYAWIVMANWAPLLFGVGMIVLTILYAVFRERFAGQRRVPR